MGCGWFLSRPPHIGGHDTRTRNPQFLKRMAPAMIVENQQRPTSQIVAAYVRKNFISTGQIAALINSVHSTLSGLGNEVVEEPPRIPAVSVRRSVHPDYIVCIECGYKAKMLKPHLQSRHGLSVAEYRTRWDLSSDYPLTSPNYSERR